MVKRNFITVFSTLNLIAVSPTCFITVIIIHCATSEECCERSNRYGCIWKIDIDQSFIRAKGGIKYINRITNKVRKPKFTSCFQEWRNDKRD